MSTDKSLPPSIKKIPFWRTIREAIIFPWDQRKYVGILTLVCALLATPIDQLWETFSRIFIEDDSYGPLLAVSILHSIANGLIFTAFAIPCHRLILLGRSSVSRWGFMIWTSREVRFFVWGLIIYVAVILLVIPFLFILLPAAVGVLKGAELVFGENSNLATIQFLIFLIPFLLLFGYILGRFSLVFPITAIDRLTKLNAVWSLSIGNGWRLAGLVGLPLVIPSLGSYAIEFFLPFGNLTSWLWYFLYNLLLYFFAAIEVALLSIAYRELSDGTNGGVQAVG